MRKSIEQMVQEMEKMTDDYKRIKVIVQSADTIVDQILKHNGHWWFKCESSETLKARYEEDDPVMMTVDANVEEWKVLFSIDKSLSHFIFWFNLNFDFKDLPQKITFILVFEVYCMPCLENF